MDVKNGNKCARHYRQTANNKTSFSDRGSERQENVRTDLCTYIYSIVSHCALLFCFSSRFTYSCHLIASHLLLCNQERFKISHSRRSNNWTMSILKFMAFYLLSNSFHNSLSFVCLLFMFAFNRNLYCLSVLFSRPSKVTKTMNACRFRVTSHCTIFFKTFDFLLSFSSFSPIATTNKQKAIRNDDVFE